MISWTEWLGVFVAVFIMDVSWAMYVRRVKDDNALEAGQWAVVIFIASAWATISFVNNVLLLGPGAIGAFTATYLTVWLDSKRSFSKGNENDKS